MVIAILHDITPGHDVLRLSHNQHHKTLLTGKQTVCGDIEYILWQDVVKDGRLCPHAASAASHCLWSHASLIAINSHKPYTNWSRLWMDGWTGMCKQQSISRSLGACMLWPHVTVLFQLISHKYKSCFPNKLHWYMTATLRAYSKQLQIYRPTHANKYTYSLAFATLCVNMTSYTNDVSHCSRRTLSHGHR